MSNYITYNDKIISVLNSSTNLENEVRESRQIAAQVIENINSLELGFLNQTTMMNLDAKKKESETILNNLKEQNKDNSKRNLSNDIVKITETLDHSIEFATPSNELKQTVLSVNDQLTNMTRLIVDMKLHTGSAREKTIQAEIMNRNSLRDNKIAQANIENIKKTSDEIKLNLDLAEQLYNESSETSSKLDGMQIDIQEQKNNLEQVKQSLTDHMKELTVNISTSVDDVNSAKEHAAKFQEKAEELQTMFASTKSSATDPVIAANAYKNISTSILESVDLVNEAKQDFDKIPENLKNINEFTVLIKDIEAESIKTKSKADEIKDKIQVHNEVIDKLVENKNYHSDSIANLKDKFEGLERDETTRNVFENITLLVNDVERVKTKTNELQMNIGNLESQSAIIKNYSDFIFDVNESKDFISRLEQLVSDNTLDTVTQTFTDNQEKFKKSEDAIRAKILDLKQNIRKARHLANYIRVGTEFSPDSSLELNLPNNVQDSTYNKLSLEFLAKEPNGLLLYIGNGGEQAKQVVVKRSPQDEQPEDFMCLEIREGHVVLTWDLGSGNPSSLTDEQIVNDQEWHQVIVERFGKLIKLIVNTNSRNKELTESKLVSPGESSIFNFNEKSTKIYVGGLNSKVKLNPIISNRNFHGTLANLIIDNEPLGFWNLKESKNIQGAKTNTIFSESSIRFNGNGYMVFNNDQLKANFEDDTYLSFNFKTYVKNGLIFLIGDTTAREYLAVEMVNGRVVLNYELGSAPCTVRSAKQYNDGNWHLVKVNRDGKESMLVVDDQDEQSDFAMGLSTTLTTDSNIYIGGFPGVHSYYELTKDGFDGCIKDFQIGNDLINLNNNQNSMGTSPGCSNDLIRVVSFSEYVNELNGYISFNLNDSVLDEGKEILFKFRTYSKNGLLFQMFSNETSQVISVSLQGGMIVVRSDQREILRTTNLFYNNNNWHYVTIFFDQGTLRMGVDDVNFFKDTSEDKWNSAQLVGFKILYVGGLFKTNSGGDFVGCIGDMTIGDKFINFAEADNRRNVHFTKCPLDGNEQEILLSPDTTSVSGVSTESSLVSVPQSNIVPPIGSCKLSPVPVESDEVVSGEELRFGTTKWSRYEIPVSNDVTKSLENEATFQLEFKTSEASGILFYITSSNNVDFAGLYFVNDCLYFNFDCGSGKNGGNITLKQGHFNDNEWHQVRFTRVGKDGLLTLDNERVEFTGVGVSSSLNVKSPIYIGGVPEDLNTQVKNHLTGEKYSYALTSFSGCVRNFKVGNLEYKFKDAGQAYDVLPCRSNMEFGHFFHYDGGLVQIFESEFRVKIEFSIKLRIKPRKPSGILVAVFGKEDYLVLYLQNNVIHFNVENGAVSCLS